MARMSEAAKRRVPTSERGVPSKSGTGSYPMPNEAHARSAEAYAAKYHGKNSAFAEKIRAKAHKLFPGMGKGRHTHGGDPMLNAHRSLHGKGSND